MISENGRRVAAWIAAGAACALLSGCAATVVDGVTDDVPSAQFTFKRGYEFNLAAVGMNDYFVTSKRNCSGFQRYAGMMWPHQSDRVVRLEAKPIVIQASTQYTTYRPGPVMSSSYVSRCHGAAALTPEVGHTYEVQHVSTPHGTCRLSVVDTTEGAIPTPIRVVDGQTCVGPDPNSDTGRQGSNNQSRRSP
jgi:hypothetical protein